MTERVAVSQLTGVPETMLWPLHNRAAEARRPDTILHDPWSVQIADSIDYDFLRSFGRPDISHPLRAKLIDNLLQAWFPEHPDGVVVALGEGLETQFHRVDNGRVRWLSVDLPEGIEVRKRFLPDTDRMRNFACSALDERWMDEVPAGASVFVTAAGLLMYLEPEQVRWLITSIAKRFPHAEMAFDVIPPWFVRLTLKGLKKTPHYTLPPMPWGLNRDELSSIKNWHPNIAEVREIPFEGGRGLMFNGVWRLFRRLPWLGNKIFSLVHLRCRPVNS